MIARQKPFRGELKVTGKLGCLVLLAISLLLTGCTKDAEINAAVAEVDSFTTELVTRINAAPNLPMGLDDAQQYLDSRKREIKAKTALLVGVRGIQINDETEKKLIETIRRDQMTVAGLPLQPKFVNISTNDAAFRTKLDKFVNDYLELFQA
jgi:hypothetical protein